MTAPSDNTANGVIIDAYRDAGKTQPGRQPSAEQFAEGMRRLRDLTNLLQTQGLKLWVNEDITVTLVAGQAAYTFLPSGDVNMTKPLRVHEAYYLYTATGVRRHLSVMALGDYWKLGNAGTLAANRGMISQYLVEKQLAQLKVTFWLCPDATEVANGNAHLLMQTQIANQTALTESTYFPLEWRIALHWGLAAEVCIGQPQAVIDRCELKAATYRQALENWDVEDAPTQFQADPRMGMYFGRFR